MNAARRKRISAVNTQEIRDLCASLKEKIEAARSEYESIRDEERDAFDNLPESMQEGEKGEAMQENISALDTCIDALEDLDVLDAIPSALDDVDQHSF